MLGRIHLWCHPILGFSFSEGFVYWLNFLTSNWYVKIFLFFHDPVLVDFISWNLSISSVLSNCWCIINLNCFLWSFYSFNVSYLIYDIIWFFPFLSLAKVLLILFIFSKTTSRFVIFLLFLWFMSGMAAGVCRHSSW